MVLLRRNTNDGVNDIPPHTYSGSGGDPHCEVDITHARLPSHPCIKGTANYHGGSQAIDQRDVAET